MEHMSLKVSMASHWRDVPTASWPTTFQGTGSPRKVSIYSETKVNLVYHREEQRKHWRVHKLVCKPPNFEAFANLNAAQCMEILMEKCLPFDQDIGPILCRLYKVYFENAFRKKNWKSVSLRPL